MNPAPPKMYYVYLLKSIKTTPLTHKPRPCVQGRGKGWIYPALAHNKSWVYPALARKGWVYPALASNLRKRLQEHQSGKCYSTKKYLPLSLVYYEAYCSKEDAYDREKKLKQHGSSLQKLKQRLNKSLSSSCTQGLDLSSSYVQAPPLRAGAGQGLDEGGAG